MKLSRMDVCRRVPMAPSTFDIWRKSGKLATFTDGTLSNARKPIVFCTLEALGKALGIADEGTLRERLGLPADEPVAHDVQIDARYEEPKAEAQPEPDIRQPDAFAPRPLSGIERKQAEDRLFAERYLAGEATDSAGNNVVGSNERFPSKGAVSLVGPMEPQVRTRLSTTSHMDAALVGDPTAVTPNPVDSDEFMERWHPGHAERKAKMYADAGLKQPSEQDSKGHVDRAAIAAAFRHGWSR